MGEPAGLLQSIPRLRPDGPSNPSSRREVMKVLTCKGTLVAAAAWLTLGHVVLLHAESCANDSLKGKYGQTISGELLPGPGIVLPQNGVAMTDFDGNGKFTQTDFVVINGSPTSTGFVSETGTYHVNSDCTGTATSIIQTGRKSFSSW